MTDPAPIHEFRTRRRVEFADTDTGGIVHFSRFFVFMESAEHELLRAIGTSVHTDLDGVKIGWPRVSASCSYTAPARFEDVLDILVRVERKGITSMTYGFLFTHEDRIVARGRLTAACCILNDPAGLKKISIPPDIAKRMVEAPSDE